MRTSRWGSQRKSEMAKYWRLREFLPADPGTQISEYCAQITAAQILLSGPLRGNPLREAHRSN